MGYRDTMEAVLAPETSPAPRMRPGTPTPQARPKARPKASIPPQVMPLLQETAAALKVPVEELATIISYETGGTFDPLQPGPTTRWGRHRGLIQFGEPQAIQYGVDFSDPERALRTQLGKNGAIVKYALAHGFTPGKHDALNLYATINAGNPNNIHAVDGKTTVMEKYYREMLPHRSKVYGVDWKPPEGGIPSGDVPQPGTDKESAVPDKTKARFAALQEAFQTQSAPPESIMKKYVPAPPVQVQMIPQMAIPMEES